MLKIGFVGAGRLAGIHARHLARLPEIQISAFDANPERSAAMATEFGGKAFETFEAMLGEVEAVAVVTPNHVHASFAIDALNAGKHVFIEKPVTLSVAEAEPILAAANARPDLVCMVGHVLRFFPQYRRLRELVLAGEVGTVAAVRMSRGGGAPGPEGSWFLDHSMSGGTILDLAVHDYDFLRWTLGPVREVVARSVAAKSGQGLDYSLTTLTMESGAVAHVEATWMDPAGAGMAFEVCGSEGMLEWDSRATATVRSSARADQHFTLDDDPFYAQMREFVGAIREGRAASVSLVEAVEAVRVGEAALESARTGRRISLV